MNTTSCKFEVTKKITSEIPGQFEVELNALVDGSNQNEGFWTGTGAAVLKLQVIDESAAAAYVVGQQWTLEFTQA